MKFAELVSIRRDALLCKAVQTATWPTPQEPAY
jgi:hypothetical protein